MILADVQKEMQGIYQQPSASSQVSDGIIHSHLPLSWDSYTACPISQNSHDNRKIDHLMLLIWEPVLGPRFIIPATSEAKGGGLQIQEQPELQIEFKAKLGNIMKPYLKS